MILNVEKKIGFLIYNFIAFAIKIQFGLYIYIKYYSLIYFYLIILLLSDDYLFKLIRFMGINIIFIIFE